MNNNVDWSKFVNLEYWFEGVAGNTAITSPLIFDSLHYNFFVVLFSFLFGVGVFCFYIKRFLQTSHPLHSKLDIFGNNFLWMGLLGGFWLFLRQAEVGFLGARMWLIVGVIWLLVTFGYAIRYFFNSYKLEKNYFDLHLKTKTK
jgi:hypothetical protein